MHIEYGKCSFSLAFYPFLTTQLVFDLYIFRQPYTNLSLQFQSLNLATGKLLREDKHFSRSMNKEFDLIFKSCSKRDLFISKSW